VTARQRLHRAFRLIGRYRAVQYAVNIPPVRRLVERLPIVRSVYFFGWELRHPIDIALGTDTGGFIDHEDLGVSNVTTYVPARPGMVRVALRQIPDPASFAFFDFGCGKGRALIVASEFPFREIIGIELSSMLVAVARANAAIIAQRYPDRPILQIRLEDAGKVELPSGPVVLFMFHPFGKDVVSRVLENLEASLERDDRPVFVIYCNPVHGECFDRSPLFWRHYADKVAVDPDEPAYDPRSRETIVIWRGGGVRPPADAAKNRPLIKLSEWGATLADQ
jgi:hypothetical protein